jgi:hypothetical protein
MGGLYTEGVGHYLYNTDGAMNVEGLDQAFAFPVKGTWLGAYVLKCSYTVSGSF